MIYLFDKAKTLLTAIEPQQITEHQQEITLNASDAAGLGVKTGDVVEVFNDRGRCVVPVYVTERCMPKVAVLYLSLLPQFITPGHGSVLTGLAAKMAWEGKRQHSLPCYRMAGTCMACCIAAPSRAIPASIIFRHMPGHSMLSTMKSD